MQFYLSALFLLVLPKVFAIPVADPLPGVSSPSSPLLDRDITSNAFVTRDPAKAPAPVSGPKKENCQKPIAQNLCTSGAPYCCSGTGSAQVCGPASGVTCESTAICCINTNGMQICAGEIDFTGPVTININV